MTFSISALVSAWDSHIMPDSKAGGLILVEGRYRKFHVIIYLSHILHWPFSSTDFYIAEEIFELTNCENKSFKRVAFVQLANTFASSLVSKRYQTMTLERVCKIYPRRWYLNGNSYFNTTYTFELIIPFQVI